MERTDEIEYHTQPHKSLILIIENVILMQFINIDAISVISNDTIGKPILPNKIIIIQTLNNRSMFLYHLKRVAYYDRYYVQTNLWVAKGYLTLISIVLVASCFSTFD